MFILVLSQFLEKLILRKKFEINFRSELCQKKQENKNKLNIQELLKNSGVESMLDLNKLIGEIKKTFYRIYFYFEL